MPYIKISYGSPRNITVQGVEYFEIDPEDLNEDGTVPEALISDMWQECVNNYMSDTGADVVENEGE